MRCSHDLKSPRFDLVTYTQSTYFVLSVTWPPLHTVMFEVELPRVNLATVQLESVSLLLAGTIPYAAEFDSVFRWQQFEIMTD